MIYVIHKILSLLKNYLNYLKDNIFEFFFSLFSQNIMIESPRSLEEKIIKNIRNLFRQDNEAKAIKDRILRDIKNLFGHEEGRIYYRSGRVNNFWSNNYTEYESNGSRSKTLSVEECLNKITPYF